MLPKGVNNMPKLVTLPIQAPTTLPTIFAHVATAAAALNWQGPALCHALHGVAKMRAELAPGVAQVRAELAPGLAPVAQAKAVSAALHAQARAINGTLYAQAIALQRAQEQAAAVTAALNSALLALALLLPQATDYRP